MIDPVVLGTAVLPPLWAGAVLARCWHRRPPARRVAELRPSSSGQSATSSADRLGAVDVSVERLGAGLRRIAGRPADPALDRRLGWALAVGASLLPLSAGVAFVAALALWCWPLLRRRRDDRSRADQLVRQLPEIVDLLLLAVGAGLTVPLAVAAVGRRADGPLAVELRRVTAEVGLGRRTADALDEVPQRLGEAVRPLVAALVASERYGAPLHDALARLAADARADRRRRAEEAARRIPVKMLFPLVCCTLPAFALLTVAPLIAGAVHDLRP